MNMFDYHRYPPIIYADDFAAHQNIAWRVEPARKHEANPLLEPQYPWESASPCVGHGTVLKDPIDGWFKGWVIAVQENPAYERGPLAYRLVFIRSKDGIRWEKPQLDACSFAGHSKTNLIFDFDSGGPTTYASVLVDPEANPDEPYEMFCFRHPFVHDPDCLVKGFGTDAGPQREMYRYRSRDGIHWRADQGPIALTSADTAYVHKDPDGTYVCHHKYSVPMHPGGRVPYDTAPDKCRVGWLATSGDGIHWSESVPNMVPDWLDAPGDQIMELGRFAYNGGYIGHTAVYHGVHQTMDVQLAASPTGKPLKTYPPYGDSGWWRPSRRAALGLEPLGDYGGGLIWPTRTLVEDGDELVLFYGAVEGLHGDIYSTTANMLHFYGAFCRASWTKGRMWAAVPASGGGREGVLETPPLMGAEGKRLIINAVTRGDGCVRAELLNRDGAVVAGYRRDQCNDVCGDHKCTRMAWKGGEACPDDGCRLRLILRRARLYGFAWQ